MHFIGSLIFSLAAELSRSPQKAEVCQRRLGGLPYADLSKEEIARIITFAFQAFLALTSLTVVSGLLAGRVGALSTLPVEFEIFWSLAAVLFGLASLKALYDWFMAAPHRDLAPLTHRELGYLKGQTTLSLDEDGQPVRLFSNSARIVYEILSSEKLVKGEGRVSFSPGALLRRRLYDCVALNMLSGEQAWALKKCREEYAEIVMREFQALHPLTELGKGVLFESPEEKESRLASHRAIKAHFERVKEEYERAWSIAWAALFT